MASRAALLAAGFTSRGIAAAVRSGRLQRFRRGWYALPDADPALIAAATTGGVLTCASVLRPLGVWVGGDPRIHVAVGRGAHPAHVDGTVVHWRRRTVPRTRLRDTAAAALVQYARCAELEFAVAAADSAIRRGLVPPGTLRRLPARVRDLVDTRAESGGESIVRLRLHRIRLHAEPQVWVDGVGRVDLLVGDRLVVEVDGFETHGTREAFERDRRRDRALVERGYLVIRVTMQQIFAEWDRIERSIQAVVRSGRHRRRAADVHNSGQFEPAPTNAV